MESKGKKNVILLEWINQNKKFKVIPLNYNYTNSNYHTRKDGITKEVLVVNYWLEEIFYGKKIGFKSYCWAIGTTSYRTDNFNLSIEKQLHLLRQFREIEENKTRSGEIIKSFKQNITIFWKKTTL